MDADKSIVKSKTDLQLITEALQAHGADIMVGDIFACDDSYHEYIKIVDIYVSKVKDWNESTLQGCDVFDDVIMVKYGRNEDWEGTKYTDSYGTKEIGKFIEIYRELKLEKSIAEYQAEAQKVIETGDFESYKDNQEINTDTALVQMNSKQGLVVLRESMEERKKHVELVKFHVNIEIKKKQQELEALRKNLGLIVEDFKRKVEVISKVIYTIELYLGVDEDIVQIQDGQAGKETDVIYFRQEVLFMDEEVGDVGDDLKGMDFQNIEQFDQWLTKERNYQKIIPEQKSIVVFRVRRNDKDYFDNPWMNRMMNVENHKTYILIRNGEKIFRIWCDINIQRLFPKRSEFLDLQQQIWDEENGKHESFRDADKLKLKLEDDILKYKQQILLMQGLLDRTEILHPIPEGLSVLKADCHDKGQVRFIYDDEIKLPDSRLNFWKWHEKINEGITFGSRVIVGNIVRGYKDYEKEAEFDRYDERYRSKGAFYSLPDVPNEGIYSVEKYSKEVTENIMEEYPNPHYRPNTDDYKFYKRRAQDENGNYKYNTYIKHFVAFSSASVIALFHLILSFHF